MPWFDIFLVSFPEAIIVFTLGLSLIGYDIKKNFKLIALTALIHSFSSFFIRSLPIPYGLNTLVQIFVVILFLKIILKLNLRSTIIMMTSGLIILSIFESTNAVLFSKFSGIPISRITTDPILRTFVPYIHFIFLTFLIYFFNKKNITLTPLLYKLKSKSININISTTIFILIFGYITILVYVSLFLVHKQPFEAINNTVEFRILTILIIFFLIIMAFTLKKVVRMSENQTMVETQEIYMKNLNELYTSFRALRHDFANQVQVLCALINDKQFEQAKKYLDSMCQNITILSKAVKVPNPVITALLQTKSAQAETNNITFDLDIKNNFINLQMSDMELTRVLGNLLDNAFESTSVMPFEKRYVKLKTQVDNNLNIIQVSNTGIPISRDIIGHIFDSGVSTKSKHSGLGLSIVKKIIEKNKGDIGVKSDETETIFTIVLPFRKARKTNEH